MDDVLALCEGLPQRTFAEGETLLQSGSVGTPIFVLVDGEVEIRKGDVTITTVSGSGSFLGEISALLAEPVSADVVAKAPTRTLVIDDPGARIASDPALALAIGRLLARRLQAVTTYLADIKRQYGEEDGHLGLMHEVLAELITMKPGSGDGGSERDDVPDY